MKIAQLIIENVKRVKVVEITPDGTIQVITGRNAQGKTSVLDAIWLAVCGGQASREMPMPIRDGEDHARVRLDLGDLIVTRTWTAKGSTLTVTNSEGAKFPSPQAMLDSLVGRLSFDPLAFTRMSGRDQRQALLDLVNIEEDLAALDVKRAALFAERTEVGRHGKALGEPEPLLPDVPEVEVSASAIVNRINDANRAEQQRSRLEHQQRERRARIDLIGRQVVELRQRITDLEDEAAGHSTAIVELASEISELPAPVDAAALGADLAVVEETNRRVRENVQRAARLADRNRLAAQYQQLTVDIEELDAAKSVLLSEAKFPVDGLGFDDSGVTYNGVPFSQASSAEQIRVAMAMAMAANPKLRVLRILDGSLLDAESMAQIAAMAKAADYQCWIERVSDPSKAAVLIEDGSVVSR